MSKNYQSTVPFRISLCGKSSQDMLYEISVWWMITGSEFINNKKLCRKSLTQPKLVKKDMSYLIGSSLVQPQINAWKKENMRWGSYLTEKDWTFLPNKMKNSKIKSFNSFADPPMLRGEEGHKLVFLLFLFVPTKHTLRVCFCQWNCCRSMHAWVFIVLKMFWFWCWDWIIDVNI